MQPREDAARVEDEAWRIARGVAFCVATVVGKFASYPDVDEDTFQRVRDRVESGLRRHSSARIGDVCQDLRGMAECPDRELVAPRGIVLDLDSAGPSSDRLDLPALRLIALTDVLRRRAHLPQRFYKEILTGLLSWDGRDRAVILGALVNIIRGL